MSNNIEIEMAKANYEKRLATYEKDPTFRNDYWKDIALDKYLDKLKEQKESHSQWVVFFVLSYFQFLINRFFSWGADRSIDFWIFVLSLFRSIVLSIFRFCMRVRVCTRLLACLRVLACVIRFKCCNVWNVCTWWRDP